jgi:hypothetical protein
MIYASTDHLDYKYPECLAHVKKDIESDSKSHWQRSFSQIPRQVVTNSP